MEWVEITASTVEEAKDAALDQLGVDTEDAEFEILEEPSRGLFGRTKGQARVRARILPTRPRPKVERRDRRRRGNSKGKSGDGARTAPAADEAPAAPSSEGSDRRRAKAAPAAEKKESSMTTVDVDLSTHTQIVSEFVTGLVGAFGLEGSVRTEAVDEESVEVRVEGSDLGLLVGPKGNTLAAIQELSRTVVHRRVSGTAEGRVRVDVAGYRQRRREALERFARQVAEEVRSSGVQKALEPMSPPDRKIVHDTVNEMDGVSTLSEGDEPRRRVVITPA